MSATVSIAVLNYQRRDALRRALEAARRQRFPILEILAVDNASTDGSAEMVRSEFPDVRLVRLTENVGAAARNAGVAAAKGEIVFTLDNDVLFTTPDGVERGLGAFDRHPRAAVVNFMIVGPDGALSRRDWCHPRDPGRWAETEFPTYYVLEGASACRREAFLAVGGYWPPFFIGHEGWDLALRLLNAGHELIYTPTVRVQHLVAPSARPSSRIYYSFVRNAVWVALRNHRPAAAAASIAQDLALVGFCAARAGELRAYARGLVDALRGARQALATREALSREAGARLQALQAQRPGLAARALRHFRERLI
ncbi:MAG TPA: glycosyltransferase family 2 protein [Methylomirabilota bacterium]|nr:glycosyltransferase family 2 protein [Methylomirabilota bacterium]